MTQRQTRSGRIVALGAVALLAPIVWMNSSALSSVNESDPSSNSESSDPGSSESPVAASIVAAPLIRAGLSAEALSACGVASSQISTVLMAAVLEWQASPTALPQADADYADKRRETDALRRKIRAGKASAQEIADYQTGMTELATALAAREAALDALRTAAGDEVSLVQEQILQQIHENRAWEELPMEFRTVSRSEADWVKLRKALLNEKTSTKYDEDPDPALASFLATSRANPTVATASVALSATLGSCQASWDAFLGL